MLIYSQDVNFRSFFSSYGYFVVPPTLEAMNFKNNWILALLSILLFLTLDACKKSNVEEKTVNHYDGSLRRKFKLVDGKIEGEMLEYYPKTGELQIRRQFKNGIQVGRTELYYPDGKLKEVQYYKEGKKEGGDTIFYTNGQPQFLVTFKQGKMDGPMRRWQENGVLFFEAFYQQDSLKEVTKKLGVEVKE